LRFDYYEYIAFDVFILQRPHARNDYSTQELAIAKQIADQLSIEQQQRLTKNIIAGLPGAEESFSLEQFRHALAEYQHIDANQLRNNLFAFLAEVLPVAEELGICLAIHPDDPPRQLFGLPRIVSTQQDLQLLIDKFGNYSSCGLNICAGSLGAREDNDLALFLQLWGDRIPFVHLRSVKREANGSFYEDEHIAGSTNLAYLVQTILQLETRLDKEIIIRPDHGHQMLDDLCKQTNPGYSCIGRMKGIAELKGMELAISSLGLSNQKNYMAESN
jgi:mannonate dehydratase